jgi:septum formation protein
LSAWRRVEQDARVVALVLASASPRRAALLHSAGLSFEQIAVECDERPRPGESPRALAGRLAAAKAAACTRDDAIVLAADTVVWCDEASLGKPIDEAEAAAFLGALAGRDHHVTTAWALAGRVAAELHESTTRVTMRALAPDEIAAYVASGEWRDKAGGYAIQGGAAGFVARIDGSYTNVVGLPLAEVVVRLRALAPELFA